jgi:hypothetical protein
MQIELATKVDSKQLTKTIKKIMASSSGIGQNLKEIMGVNSEDNRIDSAAKVLQFANDMELDSN